MPFTGPELSQAAKVGLDFYIKNNPPVDQIAVERPLYKQLKARQKDFPGAKQYVVEQLRMQYQGNLQWYRGAGTVTYNTRNSIEQANFPWQSAHDGLTLDEDRLAQNGITVTDDKRGSASDAEMIQLTNLLEEQSEILTLGFEEKLSMACHLDGTQSTDQLAGLDSLVTTAADPVGAGTQVVGGIDRFTYPVWRNQKATGLVAGTMLDQLELVYRLQSANGGGPDFITAGGAFIDTFRNAAIASNQIQRFTTAPTSGGTQIDPSISGLHFHGIPIKYSPEFDSQFGGAVSPAIAWGKRCYMLNTKALRLRPLQGQDKVARKPPRPNNQYVVHMALTWKGAMTLNNSRTQAVCAIA